MSCGRLWERLHARLGHEPLVHMITLHDYGNLVTTACDEMALPNHMTPTNEEIDCMACIAEESRL